MCGIAGFFSVDGSFSKTDLLKMSEAIAHRGPDAAGEFIEKNIGLAHRRLSVIDLSAQANQPMYSDNKNIVIAFNGEIYNYKEIAKELSFTPKTTSDTEVLLKAFEQWGVKFVNKLNGMFAIAIYKRNEQKLYLFRDRLGIKPLFYFLKDNQLAFASELKAITKAEFFRKNKAINNIAVQKFMHLGYIPQPDTIYKHTHKFPQGCYAVFDGKNIDFHRYWEAKSEIKKETIKNYDYAKNKLKDLVESSVKYRLIADVPYGSFLSGGIDSSLITAVAQKVSNKQIKTFSIGFDNPKFNELEYANAVAKHLQTKHHNLVLSESEALKLVDDIWTYYDEPYADSSAIPTMLVSKMARSNVTMALSGDGGDELFFGYGMYSWAKRLNNPLIWNSRHLTKLILNQLPPRYKRVAKLFDVKNKSDLVSHIFSQEQYFFAQKELKQFALSSDSDFLLQPLTHLLNRKISPVEKQAMFDLNFYLPDDLLTKVDRASMKYALELRVPLLDHRIVEFAVNINESLKINNGEQKFLLKQLLYDYVPQQIFDRPKWGFSVPINKWLKGSLSYLINDYLNEKSINEAGFVCYNEVQKLLNSYLNTNKEYLYNRVWSLICLHKWYSDVYCKI